MISFKCNFKISSMIGYGGKHITIKDGLFTDENFKGFDYAGIGPRDVNTEQVLGGNLYCVINLEANVPIYFNDNVKINGVVFFDGANVFKSEASKFNTVSNPDEILSNKSFLRLSYGVSTIITSSIGMMRLNYGLPLKKKKRVDKIKQFSITFGKDL